MYRLDLIHKHAATLIEKINGKIVRTAHLKSTFQSRANQLEEQIRKQALDFTEKLSHSSLRLTSTEVNSFYLFLFFPFFCVFYPLFSLPREINCDLFLKGLYSPLYRTYFFSSLF